MLHPWLGWGLREVPEAHNAVLHHYAVSEPYGYAHKIVLDLALLLDLAARAGLRGTQEWLSFYFKSPMTAGSVYPEHDLFIQSMKLKKTMRWLMGEELITHLGREYYD